VLVIGQIVVKERNLKVKKVTQQLLVHSRGRATCAVLYTLQVMRLLGKQLVGQQMQTALSSLYIAQHTNDLLTVLGNGSNLIASVEGFLVGISTRFALLDYL
jgi:hypothetical protein